MVLRKGSTVHLGRQNGVRIKSLLNGNAANERWYFAWNFVKAAEHHMPARTLQAGALQHIFQTNAAVDRSSYSALLPLHPWDVRQIESTSISCTFESIGNCGHRKLPHIR